MIIKFIKNIKPSLMIVALSVSSFALSPLTGAQSSIQSGVDSAKGNGQPVQLFGVDGIFTTATNMLLFVIGALSVVMIIVGGIRYVVSGGNSAQVTAAKNTILYAIVGLVVAFLAYAAINFLLGSLTNTTGGTNV